MQYAITLLSNVLLMLLNWVKGIVVFCLPERLFHKEVKGEIILVTGGGSGIGQLTCMEFARRGAIIVTWDVNTAGNETTCRMVKQAGGTCYAYHCDVSDRQMVYKVAKRVKDEVGVVRILVNNAGIVLGKKFLELDDDKLEKVFGVNIMAHFWTVKAFLPDMISADHGQIVLVSSIAGLCGNTHLTDYCTSKFGVVGFEEALRLELRSMGVHGVKTTVICPYFTNTGLFDGVSSSILPLLEPKYVAEKLVSGVLCENNVVLIPWYITYIFFLKCFLPLQAQLNLYDVMGGNDFMAHFVGRVTEKANGNANNNNAGKIKENIST